MQLKISKPSCLILLSILMAHPSKAQSLSTLRASFITANTGSEQIFFDSFGMAVEYQRKLEAMHLFGGFSFTSAMNSINNPSNGDEALDGYLQSLLGFEAGVEYVLVNREKNDFGFGIGPSLRSRKEVQPTMSVERRIWGEEPEILVQNRYSNKIDFGIVAFLDYTYAFSAFALNMRSKYGTFGVQNGVFSLELGIEYTIN